MIKKLRKKFILINMSLIFLILIIVFGILIFFQDKRLKGDISARMNMVLDHPYGYQDDFKGNMANIPAPGPASLIPVYMVFVTEDGMIVYQESNSSTLSSDLLKDAVEAAINSPNYAGVLKQFQIRFLKRYTPEGIRLAFVELDYEKSSIYSLLFLCTAVLALALIAFFFITLFLSKWVLRPVEKAWMQQNQFVADASHELKTPLTVILANLNIILAHPNDTIQKQMKWIENTYAESERMKKLVDQLLFLAKSDAVQIPDTFTSFHLSDAAWSCLLPFESIAFEKKINIVEEISPDIWIYGNEEQLKQLMVILIDNACKYTSPQGTVHFRLYSEQNKVFLKVSNTGDPISPDDLEHIFERFYRSDKSRVHQNGGYGLGLTIAQTIIQKHHGKIQVSSTVEEGTIFSVLLPLESKNKKI